MSRGAAGDERDSDEDAAAAAAENALHSQRRRPYSSGRLPFLLRLLVPAAAALALVSVITDDAPLDHDLLLIAPARAEAGATIALRALLYAGLNKPEGPALVHGKTVAELRAPSGEVLSHTILSMGFGPSLEGELAVPKSARGKLMLIARTQAGDERVEVERALTIGAAEPAVLGPRALGPLQQLAHGPIHVRDGELAPSSMLVRVAGDACVPELPCELLVHVGEPAAIITALSTPSVTVEGPPHGARGAPPLSTSATSAIVALRVHTHGPEGHLELRASRPSAGLPLLAASAPVAATRAVRLPVALGAAAMQLERVVLAASDQPRARLLGDSTRGIADVFAGDRWSSSRTLSANQLAPLASKPLAPGLYRAQLRRDPFESDSAAVRSFYVRGERESDRDVLLALAKRVVARHSARPPEERDALAARLVRHDDDTLAIMAAADFEGASRYLLAALDEGIYRLPGPASSFPIARKRALEHRQDVRRLALVILALAAVSLVLMLVQRGLAASEQAATVLRASGIAQAGVRRERLRMTLRVLGSAFAVLLVFCAIALYLIVRGRAP
jgi:hypothetical protein